MHISRSLLTLLVFSAFACTPVPLPTHTPEQQQPTPQPAHSAIPSPHESPTTPTPTTPQPTPSPIPVSPTPYQVLEHYTASLNDTSSLLVPTHTNPDTLFWFNEKKRTLQGLLTQALDAPLLSMPLPSDPHLQARDIQIYSAMGPKGQGLYVATLTTDPGADIISSPRKNSHWTMIQNNAQLGQAQTLPQVVYGLSANAEGNGWVFVSDEHALPASLSEQSEAQKAAQGTFTTLSRIPLQNWEPMVNSSPTPLLKVPHFFQGTPSILALHLDLTGQGIVLTQTHNTQLTLHRMQNFSPVGTQTLTHLNPGTAPGLDLENGSGHIDWHNGQLTPLQNLVPQDPLTLSQNNTHQYFLNASGDGYRISRESGTLYWQSISGYAPDDLPEQDISFLKGSLIQSLAMNLGPQGTPLLMGMNYTCEDTPENCQIRTAREVWISPLETVKHGTTP